MRVKILAVVGTAALLLAGCGDDGGGNKPATQAAPPADPPRATAAPSSPPAAASSSASPSPAAPTTATSPRPPGCDDPEVSVQYWVTLCGGTVDNHPGNTPEPTGPRQLGQTALTTGEDGGTLQITPTTVVYATGDDTGTVPERDGYVVILIRIDNKSAVATGATEHWTYTGSDGEALGAGVVLSSAYKQATGNLQPGTFQWYQRNWGIGKAQKGGTITYTDGTGVTYTWKLPAVDTGPQVAEVTKGLK